jgi:hypothetical protein
MAWHEAALNPKWHSKLLMDQRQFDAPVKVKNISDSFAQEPRQFVISGQDGRVFYWGVLVASWIEKVLDSY